MLKVEFEIKHTTQLRVRYADTDKMGVVYYGNYFAYFEVGRAELMRSYGLPYSEFETAGYFLPLIETKAEYKNSAHYDDLLNIEAVLKASYSPRVRFEYNIFRDDTTIAVGYTVHSFLDAEKGRPVKPPKMFIEFLKSYQNRMLSDKH